MTTQHELEAPSKPFRYKAPLFILLLFLVSVLLRFHSLNDSVRGGHAWLSAHTVLTLQIWFDEGISKHQFSPIYTFENETDKNMRSLASGLADDNGNYYYVSYPPFSFIFAFLILKLLGIYPSLFSLQIINLGIHLITSWLLYAVVCRFYRKKTLSHVYGPALVASIIYLFSMHPLWCHSYVYFADTLIQMIWVAGIYSALGLFMTRKIEQWRSVLAFGLLIFISIYTEWLGVFFAATVFCIAAIFAVKDRIYIRLMVVIAASTCLALGLFFLQYGTLNDLSSFIEASFAKYFERSGYNADSLYYTKLNIQFVIRHYMRLYFPQAAMILFLLLAAFVNKKERATARRAKEFALLFAMIVLPILAHHSAFLGFTRVHDFALLKSSIFAAIAIAILFNRSTFYAIPSQKKFFQLFSSGVIGLLLILSLFSYYDFIDLQESSIFEEAAEVVNNTSSDEEALYIVSQSDQENGIMIFMAEHRSISPQVQMLARRNMLGVLDKDEAVLHMIKFGYSKGRVYTLNTKGRVISNEEISLP